jgi:hypothetical protein
VVAPWEEYQSASEQAPWLQYGHADDFRPEEKKQEVYKPNIGNPAELLIPTITGAVGGTAGMITGLGRVAYERGRAAITGEKFDPQFAADEAKRRQQEAGQIFQFPQTGSMMEKGGRAVANVMSKPAEWLGEAAKSQVSPSSPVGQYLAEMGGQAVGGALTGKALGAAGKMIGKDAAAVSAPQEPSFFTPDDVAKLKEMQPKIQDFQGNLVSLEDAHKLQKQPVVDSGIDVTPVESFETKKQLATPEMLDRANVLKSVGVDNPTRWQLTQNDSHLIEEQRLSYGDSPVTKALADQQVSIGKKANEWVNSFGGSSTNLAQTNASVKGAVTSQFRDVDAAVKDAYAEARKISADKPLVQVAQTRLSVQDPELFDILQARGNEGFLKSLESEVKRFADQNKNGATVEAVENFRKRLNAKYYDPKNPTTNMALEQVKNALDLDTQQAVGEDVFKDARQAYKDREQMLNRPKADEYDKYNRPTLLRQILDNSVDESKIVDKIESGSVRPDDVSHLMDFLENNAGARGKQAAANIRAQIARNAFEYSKTGKLQGNIDGVNLEKIGKYFQEMKDSGKIDILYDKGQQGYINNSTVAGRLMRQNVRPEPSDRAGLVKQVAEKLAGGEGKEPILPIRAAKAAMHGIDYLREKSSIDNILNPLETTKKALGKND